MRALAVLVALCVAGAVVALMVGITKASEHTVELAPILMLLGGALALVRALMASIDDGPIPLVGGPALMISAFVARHAPEIAGKALLFGFALFALSTAAGKRRRLPARIAGGIAALSTLILVADHGLVLLAGGVYLVFPVAFAIDAGRSAA